MPKYVCQVCGKDWNVHSGAITTCLVKAGGCGGPLKGEKPKANKYHAEKTEYNGRLYDSKAEARVAENLDLMKHSGGIVSWMPQVSVPLTKSTRIRPDFLVVSMS